MFAKSKVMRCQNLFVQLWLLIVMLSFKYMIQIILLWAIKLIYYMMGKGLLQQLTGTWGRKRFGVMITQLNLPQKLRFCPCLWQRYLWGLICRKPSNAQKAHLKKQLNWKGFVLCIQYSQIYKISVITYRISTPPYFSAVELRDEHARCKYFR